jgi:peptidoglycan/LPS O-acetylase OafA/YrhL
MKWRSWGGLFGAGGGCDHLLSQAFVSQGGLGMTYMRQLDSIRGIAVLFVLFEHLYSNHTKPLFKNHLGWGNLGVGIFFVLSGFLITRILLRDKDSICCNVLSYKEAITKFFIRRSIRIFPIYFMVIFAAYVVGLPAVHNLLWYLVSYCVNIYFAIKGDWVWPVTHLWSLSVEEQFYFLWPFIILFTPKKRLLATILLTISFGPLYRHLCVACNTNYLAAHVITFSNFDLLGMGALLSYIRHYHIDSRASNLFLKLCFWIGGALFFESKILQVLDLPNSFSSFNQIFEAVFYCSIINKAADGIEGLAGRFLDFKPLIFIGKISYGVYLYHLFIFGILLSYLNKLPTVFRSPEIQLVACTLATIITATLSWYIIELPLSGLKSKLEGLHQRRAMDPDAVEIA